MEKKKKKTKRNLNMKWCKRVFDDVKEYIFHLSLYRNRWNFYDYSFIQPLFMKCLYTYWNEHIQTTKTKPRLSGSKVHFVHFCTRLQKSNIIQEDLCCSPSSGWSELFGRRDARGAPSQNEVDCDLGVTPWEETFIYILLGRTIHF